MLKNTFRLDWSVLVLLFLVITLGLSFFRNVSRINRIKKETEEAQINLNKVIMEGEDLKSRLSQSQDEFYIERQIRDKLGLAKDGEIVLILPPDETLRELAMDISEEDEVLPDPNWKKWIKIFF
jgi:cell division protein FtsB